MQEESHNDQVIPAIDAGEIFGIRYVNQLFANGDETFVDVERIHKIKVYLLGADITVHSPQSVTVAVEIDHARRIAYAIRAAADEAGR